MSAKDDIYVEYGSDVKLKIKFETPTTGTIFSVEKVEVFCSPNKKWEVPDKDQAKEGEDTLYIKFNTEKIGLGKVVCRAELKVKDDNFGETGIKEVVSVITNVQVVKTQ